VTAERTQGADPAERSGGGQRRTFNTSIAHQARIYDYLIGGKDNFAADREAGDAMIAAQPDTVAGLRANRQYMTRAVHYLAAEEGIRQFLDLGTGIPTAPNVHQVAQEVAPASRVAYVDYDPVVLSYARALMVGTPEGRTDFIDADLRDTDEILERSAQILDFSEPVAVTVLMTLHAITDADDPHAVIATIMRAMPPGSYLALTHPASDIDAERMAAMRERVNQLSFQQYTFRDRYQVSRFFDGLDLVAPGLVSVEQWHPAIATGRVIPVWAGVGRKR
jgi:SAM-dependent methyltransferase